MIAEFTRRRGYDPTPYLPVLVGRVVDNAATSDRFLWDFRRTLADSIPIEGLTIEDRVTKLHGVPVAQLNLAERTKLAVLHNLATAARARDDETAAAGYDRKAAALEARLAEDATP